MKQKHGEANQHKQGDVQQAGYLNSAVIGQCLLQRLTYAECLLNAAVTDFATVKTVLLFVLESKLL